MKAISLWQPWASAMALGLKTFETRSWTTMYRGPLAIHAARKSNRELNQMTEMLLTVGPFAQAFHRAGLFSFSMLPRGCVVAVGNLTQVWSTANAVANGLVDELEAQLGDYTPGRYAWRWNLVGALATPYHMGGHQGFFDVPDDLLANAKLTHGGKNTKDNQ